MTSYTYSREMQSRSSFPRPSLSLSGTVNESSLTRKEKSPSIAWFLEREASQE